MSWHRIIVRRGDVTLATFHYEDVDYYHDLVHRALGWLVSICTSLSVCSAKTNMFRLKKENVNANGLGQGAVYAV